MLYYHLFLVVLLASVAITSAFQATPLHLSSTTSTQLELFGGGKASSSAKNQRVVTVNGKPVPSARTGQKILAVAKRARVNIPTYCERGACGTCCCYLNGRKVHACMETLPAGRAEIQTM